MINKLSIKNSTIEFLIFTKNSNEIIEARFFDENIWLTQKLIARLFDVDRSVITKHLKNIFEEQELKENSVSAKFAHTATDGKKYNTKYYNIE